jgi:6,7-dimethyl-8-ribityllumazine synthase
MPEIAGTPNGKGRRIAVIASRFNEPITAKLVEGALDALTRHGTARESIDVVWVPGAWELPAAAVHLLEQGEYDALVALGAVIRGETPHFDYVAGEASRGLARASTDYGRPIGFGLLTCDDMQQAESRAGGSHGNKGWDAALAALEMADLFERIDGSHTT